MRFPISFMVKSDVSSGFESVLITLLCISAVIIAILVVIKIITKKLKNLKSKMFLGLSGSDISTLIKGIDEASQEPEAKTVGGMTNIYEPLIIKDFADFHNLEAVSAIKTFMCEYLNVKYGKQKSFKESNADKGIICTIDISQTEKDISDIEFHNVVIQNYVKTNEYATITYGVSLKYTLENKKQEERYRIEYTLKLKENNIETKTLICENCGAALESTAIESCPYCGTRIIRDTRMSWLFTSVQEY